MAMRVVCFQSQVFQQANVATLKKGDIIRFPRDAYDHFGLYIGQGQVIHRSGPPGGPSSAPDSASSFSGGKSSKAEIRIDKLQVVAGDSKRAEIANYLDTEMTAYSPDDIVKRAKSKLGQVGYNVMFMNCEHFVTWCRYGVEYSKQVIDKFRSVVHAVTSPTTFIVMEIVRAVQNATGTGNAYQ